MLRSKAGPVLWPHTFVKNLVQTRRTSHQQPSGLQEKPALLIELIKTKQSFAQLSGNIASACKYRTK